MKNFRRAGRFHDKRVTFDYYTGAEGAQVKVSLGYREKGFNYTTYKPEDGALQMVVTCMNISYAASGARCEHYSPMEDQNFRVSIEPASRYNAKRLEKLAEAWDDWAAEFGATYLRDRQAGLQMLRERLGQLEAA